MSTRERILDAAEALVHEHGFAATSVDAVLAAAPASKGAFFHHFPSKAHLGRALVERYARADAQVLERFMAAAERESDDPAEQVVAFVRLFEEAADGIAAEQPGCLFVSFLYERGEAGRETRDVIAASVELWRSRLLVKLRMAARFRPPVVGVDLESLADQVFTTFEGAFILARATGDPGRLRAQFAHLRTYLALVFDVPAVPSKRSLDGGSAVGAP
ncbi:TetR/AcrR family transcriptional regulator [Actinomadura welshii]